MGTLCSCVECVEDVPDPTPEELAAYKADLAKSDAEYRNPPCQECGAMTQEDAETKCRCAGDKDHCHGCDLWQD